MPSFVQPFVSTKETGLGLGLVDSRAASPKSHGGSLRRPNMAEGGACFTLRLPVLLAIPDSSAQVLGNLKTAKSNEPMEYSPAQPAPRPRGVL